MGAIAFVLKGYPRLSETFIAQEIHALERRGLDLRIVSLRHPTDRHVHPVHREIAAPVLYLPEYLYQEPRRVSRGWRAARRLPTYPIALAAWWRDLRRDPTPNRIRRFGQALVLAREVPAQVTHLHAHFLHTPASVTRYTSLLTGLPWSCSAHARDIWTSPDWEKREKLQACRWAVTCTDANCHHLAALAPDPERVERLYHGLDFTRFADPGPRESGTDGRNAEAPVTILSVGRAVEKKGYDDLLAALGALPRSLNWRFVHIGGGPLRERLKDKAKAQGVAERIEWLGALPQESVLERYREADVFVLASRIARDGDRDGLPNVLMEAQSQRLACLATRVSAIPELIEHGVNGLLVAPGDVTGLAGALESLITAPDLRLHLGEAGAGRLRRRFDFEAGIERLAAKFQVPAGG